ncbi:MAG: SIMPL domain-containing protein [Clostridiaceae bacterium]|nr:SIMPL domain-containing protein [Clostridiaceae bacterium]
MSINGRGVLKVAPDIAIVTMGVITENKSLKIAQDENSVMVTNVIQELIKQGISSKDIQTVDYNIEEQYDNVDGKQIFRAYRVKNAFRVTLRDIKRVGEVIDAAVSKGINSINGISFEISEPDKYYNIALKKALDQAVFKAQAIKSASRIFLNSTPIRITEESTNYLPVYEPMLLKATTTPVGPGEIQISASLKAVFQYKQY